MDSPSVHGPTNLIFGAAGALDVPSGVSARTRSIRVVRTMGYEHFVPATGRLEIVSMERIDHYPPLSEVAPIWKRFANGDWSSLDDARRILYHQQLSEIPWINEGRDIHAKLHCRTFSWGKAVLFITEYANANTGLEVGDDQLYLTVQGFTSDGRYAVNGRFAIDGPDRRNFPRKHFLGLEARTAAEVNADDDLVAAWLTAQPDDSFDPSIRQYEKFLDSLRIEPPKWTDWFRPRR